MRACPQTRQHLQKQEASSPALANKLTPGPGQHQHPLLRLQRTAGNHAVQQLLQTKLKVSAPGDVYEQEADRVAEQVMRMPEPFAVPANVRRKCAECEEEDKVQRQEAGTAPGTARSIVPDVLNSPGQPLDASTRSFMEPRFGFDFSQVRIHTDSPAAESARSVNARAYTVGTHVVFGPGESPCRTRHLLAHELAHVVQNFREASPPGLVRRQPAVAEPPKAPSFADRLDYDDLAERIHDAIKGWGTDEEAVYLALQRLNRDPDAIARLKKTYEKKYGTSLLSDIYGDFSGTELEYALQLLGQGDPGSAQSIKAAPSSVADLVAAADRLHDAMEGAGTDEEAIFAVLRPFDREKDLLLKLRIEYFKKYKKGLREEIDEEMSFSELDYALWLLGEQPIERHNARAEADAKAVLQHIKAEAKKNAKTPPVIDESSKFYKALKDRYLADYLAAPTAEKGKEAAGEKIGGGLKGRNVGTKQAPVVIVQPAGHPERPAFNRWEVMAIMWLNRQQIPPQIQKLKDYPLFQNIGNLPAELGAATNILAIENVTLLPFIDVPALLGRPNTDLDFDADVTGGGKNISQLMHWATGVKYSDRDVEAMRELFLGYEIWHLEGFDVFGQDSLNDMIAEYQGLLLGKELRKGAAGAIKSEADLLPFLTRSFQEARAWVGTILKLRQDRLDKWILQKQQKPASIHYMKDVEVWHSLTVYQMLADGQPIDKVKQSMMVQSAIEIYTLIFEAEEWASAHGAIELTPLEKALVQGKLDGLLEVMAKLEEGKADSGELLEAKSMLDDLKGMK